MHAQVPFMRRVISSSFMVWLVLAGVGLYYVLPLKKHLRFGIDLVGGTYITLEVQAHKAIEDRLKDRVQAVLTGLKKAGTKLSITSQTIVSNNITVEFSSEGDAERFDQQARRMENAEFEISRNNNSVVITCVPKVCDRIMRDAVHSVRDVLDARLNKNRSEEILVAIQGDRHIIVELPDVHDPQQAKKLIGTSAQLEFRLVEKTGGTAEDLLAEYDGELPVGREILPSFSRTEEGEPQTYYLVSDYAEVTGKYLKAAHDSRGGGHGGLDPVVNFEFNAEGARRFGDLTGRNVGKQLAIVLDGVIISAPVIQQRISSNGMISGNFTVQEARHIAGLLKSGSFVAPVTFEEERHIGPSLGASSIYKGLIACLVGLFFLLMFSLFYYKLAGLIAFIALLYNLLLIIIILSYLGATLTLPGIAGMVLTIGMAIDASILIYEKIKEEVHQGVEFSRAVQAGFSDALIIILDANITHLLVGLVLYYFGTGPIQGFAVTLIVGIVSTLLSGLLFLRSFFTFLTDIVHVRSVPI